MSERRNGGWEDVLKLMFPGYVLIGTEQIEDVYKLIVRVQSVLDVLQNDDEFLEVRLEEIARLIQMADDNGIIQKSQGIFDENNLFKITSDLLNGHDDWIVKYRVRNRRVVEGHNARRRTPYSLARCGA
ncbi:hypothetical protein LQZ18_01710 [Lachnospiraceae bacterium ZAX-1]